MIETLIIILLVALIIREIIGISITYHDKQIQEKLTNAERCVINTQDSLLTVQKQWADEREQLLKRIDEKNDYIKRLIEANRMLKTEIDDLKTNYDFKNAELRQAYEAAKFELEKKKKDE